MYKIKTSKHEENHETIFDALIILWKYAKFRYDYDEYCELWKNGELYKSVILNADYNDNFRLRVDKYTEIYTIGNVTEYLNSKDVKLSSQALTSYINKNLNSDLENNDYIKAGGQIIFKERGLKKIFYNYLGIELF